jgi:molybdate transport system permease protein
MMEFTAADWGIVALSLQVALAATAGALPIAVLVAWALARKRFPGKMLLDALVTAPLVMPPLVTGYLLLLLLGRNGLIGKWLYTTFGITIALTWVGAAIASAVLAFPLMVRSIQVAIEGIDPRLEAMSRTLGSGRLRTFMRVTLPLATPGLIAGILLGFARCLGEFGATIILAGNIPGKTQTIPLAIYSALNRPGGEGRVMALLLISLIISLGALIISYLFTGRRRGRDAGGEPREERP